MFSPLNLREDPSTKKELEEDHTREIEIENAFLTYQKAISLQDSGDLVAAYAAYQDLSASAIIAGHYYEEAEFIRGVQNGLDGIQVDELTFVAQNVKNIRYLYLRNRSFLTLSIMRAGPETLERVFESDQKLQAQAKKSDSASQAKISAYKELAEVRLNFFKELFYSMLDNLVSCMMYQETDETVLRLLFDVYTFLDFRRLAKFTLELAQSLAAESDDIVSILPINNWVIKLRSTLHSWKNGESPASSDALVTKLSFLQPIKDDLAVQCNKITALNPTEVSVKAGAHWDDVLNAINIAVKQTQDREKAQSLSKSLDLDPYLASEFSADHLKFKIIPEDDLHDLIIVDAFDDLESAPVQSDEPAEPAELLEPADGKLATPTPIERPATAEPETQIEKTSMRVSRRLNPDDLNPISADGILLTRRYFVETEGFFDQINYLFAELYPETPAILQDVIGPLVDTNSVPSKLLYISDFFKTLNEWKIDLYEEIIFRQKSDQVRKTNSANSDKKKLIEVLTRFGNNSNGARTHPSSLEQSVESESVAEFLTAISESKLHISLLRKKILSHLFQSAAYLSWSDSLNLAILDWISFMESDLFVYYECMPEKLNNGKDVQFALGIYEFLVNQFISTKKQAEESLESSSETLKSAKGNSNATLLKILHIRDRLHKWSLLLKTVLNENVIDFNDSKLVTCLVRFLWTTNYLIAVESLLWNEKKFVVTHLQQLQSILQEHQQVEFEIPFPNYVSIGEFSYENLHRRLSTASILAIFSKILDSSDLSFDANDDTISLLEHILTDFGHGEENGEMQTSKESQGLAGSSLVISVVYGHATLDSQSLQAVKDFLNECPVDLRLNLWNILFLYYQKASFEKYQQGFELYLTFMINCLAGAGHSMPQRDRSILILQLIASFDGYLKVLLKNLAANKWILPNSQFSHSVILNLSRLFEMSYCFSLHEESALITGSKISLETKSMPAFEYFKGLVIDCITILLVYLFSVVRELQPEKLESFVSTMLILVHNQLGIRRLCDSAKGLFLRFAEDVLVGLLEVPDKELAQILSCRFHYKVKLNGQFPTDHYTEKVGKLDKESAQELAAFILPFCFRRNPLTHTPRNDLKQIVEDLYEIIGDPDLEKDMVLAENLVKFETFCDQTLLSPRFIKEAFHGLLHVPCVIPSGNCNSIASKGLYFMEAVLMFNFYKIRKKSAQSRTVELEKIVSLLYLDLAHGSERVESWILLGQAYGFLVEDDLIWTSDKLNMIDRKVITANSQRKAIVSYLMAISTMTQKGLTDVDNMKSVIAVLMNSLTKELYSACFPPMSMTAFMVYPAPRLIRKNGQSTTLSIAETPLVSRLFCLKLMLQCIKLSIRSNGDDWSLFYYLAKIKAKLKHEPLDVLLVIQKSSTLAKAANVPGDLILEPAYKYFSLIYKYVKTDQLEPAKAIELIDLEPMVKLNVDLVKVNKENVFIALVNCFTRMMAMDKKGWYHKPSYRQAFIVLHEFNDLKKAKDCMAKYFSLKLATKTFLQMWKPENERAGKHFVYMYQYARFYITVLTRERDLSSLILMFPKLRKANSTMVQLYFAWDHMCSSLCKFIREIFDIEENAVERFLAGSSHAVFVANARVLVDSFTGDSVTEPVCMALCSLSVISEMRKLNNGFGPTSLIDDTYTAFLLMIYNNLVLGQKPQNDIIRESPNGKVKRLAKKDLFPFAAELTSKAKRFTDARLKDNPNIFNELVARHEARTKQIWAMLQIAMYKNHIQRLGFVQRVNFESMAANQWWLFELKLAMKKNLYSTIPDSKRLIQEDEDEIMELATSLDMKNPSKSINLETTDMQHYTMAKAYVASVPEGFMQLQMAAIPAVYLNPVHNVKVSNESVEASNPSTLPAIQIGSDDPTLSATKKIGFDSESAAPQSDVVLPEVVEVVIEDETPEPKPTKERSSLDTKPASETVEKPKRRRVSALQGLKKTDLVVPVVIDIESDDESTTPEKTNPKIELVPTTETAASNDAQVSTSAQESVVVEPTSSKDSFHTPDISVESFHSSPYAVLGIPVKSSPTKDKDASKSISIAIEEPNEPIFVPRRRSSRQREILKNRLNGLSKDVPIVVEIEDEGPKRSQKSIGIEETGSKRKRVS